MFENRSNRELIVIYAFIAFLVSFALAIIHYYLGFHLYYVIIAANIEFFCVFYILYLPLKYKRKT